MSNLFGELKRRNVFRVAAAYAVVGWLVLQVVTSIEEPLGLPAWTDTLVIVLLGIGFPIALLFAWAFEMTPEGVKKTEDVNVDESITSSTGQKLNYIIIATLALALGYFIWESRFAVDPAPADVDTLTADTGKYDSKSVAVLPFSNLSGNPETDTFVAGLHDDLLTQLSKINDLRVISRTSVLKYAGTERSLREIGQELGVGTLMEGGIQRAGNRVRINVQLIDAGTDEHIWAETYDRVLTAENVFDIQSEITLEIASALNAALSDSEQATIAVRPTNSMEAYDAYMNSRLLLASIDANGLDYYDVVIEAAETAVRLDPRFAEAWAQLASARLTSFWDRGRDPTEADAAWAAIQRGEAIRPNVPEILEAKGYYYYWVHFDYDKAIPEFEKAIAAQPGFVDAWGGLGFANRRAGNWAAAIAALVQANDLAPNDPPLFAEIAVTYLYRHRFSDADKLLSLAARRFPGVFSIDRVRGELVREITGRRDALLKVLGRAVGGNSEPEATAKFDYVITEGLYGDRQRALEYLADWAPGPIDVQYQYWPEELLRGYILYHSGAEEEARNLTELALAKIEQVIELEPDSAEVEKARGIALAVLGRTDEATASARRVREVYPLTFDAFGGSNFYAGAIAILAMSGNNDLAFDWLTAYLETDAPRTLIRMSTDPAFAGIIVDPRFAALVDQYGLVPADRSDVSGR